MGWHYLRLLLSGVAMVFVAAMIVNTAIALHYRWPAMFDAPGNPHTTTTDFVLYGTRISPPAYALVILAFAAVVALRRGWPGLAATVVLVAFSALSVIAGAGEPAGLPPNNVPSFVWTVVGTIGQFAPILVIAAGLSELVRRALSRYARRASSTKGR